MGESPITNWTDPLSDTDEGLEVRRRRALWRAGHRGAQELDLLLGAFARDHLASMGKEGLSAFESLLESADPDLLDWLLAGVRPPDRFVALVAAIRALHIAPVDFTSR